MSLYINKAKKENGIRKNKRKEKMDMSDKEFYNKRLQNEMNRNNVIDRAGDLEKKCTFLEVVKMYMNQI